MGNSHCKKSNLECPLIERSPTLGAFHEFPTLGLLLTSIHGILARFVVIAAIGTLALSLLGRFLGRWCLGLEVVTLQVLLIVGEYLLLLSLASVGGLSTVPEASAGLLDGSCETIQGLPGLIGLRYRSLLLGGTYRGGRVFLYEVLFIFLAFNSFLGYLVDMPVLVLTHMLLELRHCWGYTVRVGIVNFRVTEVLRVFRPEGDVFGIRLSGLR